ncbi:lipid II flippase MurJ [Latilactobacillus graminis]|uniref:Peptidoglycan lipid II flippase n=2 Tax=Latilactobacillus graminis TaxID=60519 RepID=A0AA89I160_9LACO|nr:lipid II flippase MurJ [Latilactobacillus graminis]KRM21031.1 hypothetical protein FC90_GL001566 [Latilactobacillus graminis DSM 20719]QFP79166.1 hypothetical protein LG542_02505 [Latilactobacillus graminis]
MKKIVRSFPAIVLISTIITIFGLLKSVILSQKFGASSVLDSFYLANVFTVSIFSVVSSAITTVVMPKLNSINRNEKDDSNLEEYLSVVFIVTLIIGIIGIILLYVFRSSIVGQYDSKLKSTFISMIIILFIAQLSRINVAVYTAVYQSKENYIIPRLTDIIPALIPVVYIMTVAQPNIMYVTLLTAISYFLQFVALRRIQDNNSLLRVRFKGFLLNEQVKTLLRNTVPILISSTIFQIQILFSNYFANNFGNGYVTIFTNANQVIGIFQALFIVNIVNLFYPTMIRKINKNLIKGLSESTYFIGITMAFVILIFWGYASVGSNLIDIVFIHGKFTKENAHVVYTFGLVLCVVLPIDVIRDFIYRVYYAVGNTKKPMINSVLTVIFNIIMLMVLSKIIGPMSIVLAPAIGTIFSTSIILIRLYKDNMSLRNSMLVMIFIIFNLLGLCMYGVLYLVKVTVVFNGMVTVALQVVIGIAFSVTVLLLLLYFLKEKELIEFK